MEIDFHLGLIGAGGEIGILVGVSVEKEDDVSGGVVVVEEK